MWLRVGVGVTSKNVCWNDVVKATVERKESASKEILGFRSWKGMCRLNFHLKQIIEKARKKKQRVCRFYGT